MVKESNTINKKHVTQELYELVPKLLELMENLENTENESNEFIQFAYDNNLITLFNNSSEVIKKQLKRIYYGK